MKRTLLSSVAVLLLASLAAGQPSPPDQANITVGGKTISIKYSAPSVKGRTIFGDGGLLSGDGTYPVWRAGANSATALHTDAALTSGNLNIPPGDYTLYVNVKDPNAWELIVSKQTGQWGTVYKPEMDLGRVKMMMTKPSAPVEKLKYDLKDEGGKVKLTLSW